jgi:hypothetical protein
MGGYGRVGNSHRNEGIASACPAVREKPMKTRRLGPLVTRSEAEVISALCVTFRVADGIRTRDIQIHN